MSRDVKEAGRRMKLVMQVHKILKGKFKSVKAKAVLGIEINPTHEVTVVLLSDVYILAEQLKSLYKPDQVNLANLKKTPTHIKASQKK